MDILISGLGIAGPTLAYWLLRSTSASASTPHRITILERAPTARASGQSIDIRQSAVDIIRSMGVEPAVRAHTTHEAGVRFVDDQGKSVAEFPATGDAAQQGFTSEYEILRGDLVRILYGLVEGRVRVVYGTYVTEFTDEDGEEEDGGVVVKTNNGEAEGRYDALIACDGLSSRIRRLMLGFTPDEDRQHWTPFYNYASYFTVNTDLLRGSKVAAWYNTTLGRVLFIRPDPDSAGDKCRVTVIRQLLPGDERNNARYREALKEGPGAMRALIREDYRDVGWLGKEVVRALEENDAEDKGDGEGEGGAGDPPQATPTATDFYASETAQVRAPHIGMGRVALVGDAGYCPTPISGMGTSLAIIGAYVLAGELSKVDLGSRSSKKSGPEDVSSASSSRLDSDPETTPTTTTTHPSVRAAMAAYESTMLPYARTVQNVPPLVPRVANPQTWWGLAINRWVLWLVWKSGVVGWVGALAGATSLQKKGWEPPVYDWAPGLGSEGTEEGSGGSVGEREGEA